MVVGGGLAGIAAALELADAGVEVTLVEARPRLGGLAFSFRRGDLWVDNGQHVFLRCCTAYRQFVDRIGGSGLVTLQERLDVPVLDVAGTPTVVGAPTGAGTPTVVGAPTGAGTEGMRFGRLRRSALPVPLHLAASLIRYPHLSAAERVSVGRAALALRGLDPADPALDGRDFASWLREHGQSPRTIEALWDLVGVATLNARAEHASLGLAAMVFRTGLLSEPGAADIGWANAPLGELHDTTARAALDRAGVSVMLRSRASGIADETDGFTVTVEAGPSDVRRLPADAVVLAVPQEQAHPLVPKGALEEPGKLLEIRSAPILNVHVVYDRRVLRRPFFAALGTPVQWVFDRTHSSGLTGGGQYLALSQSAAQDEIDTPTADLRARYLPELERVLPAARDAKVEDFFVTRERTATFAPEPGVGRLRPGARTRTPGFYLAGAWTDTGWPATMEGAVRSGLHAAREALTGLGRPTGHISEGGAA
ncbi:phytoene dehydrogenase [Wenjunlia tyrosinilytica]|uniref:Phytoene dehydrogenase n=1 Tax=Wenjunlia tyrosinilytica TaxID=1544741 RepID=A0A917ZV72_9ACTN|nr:phytoene dehydrogenase [Wenjunlia tyrosinilytica]